MNLQGRLDKLERALPPSPVADPYDLPRVQLNPWQRSAAALPPSPVADPYDPSDILLMLSDPEACNLSCEQIEAIERPKAEERQQATQAKPGNDGRTPTGGGTFPPPAERAKTRDAVAQAIGGMSGRTYEKAKVVVGATEAEYLSCKAALDARQAELDAGGGACESTLAT